MSKWLVDDRRILREIPNYSSSIPPTMSRREANSRGPWFGIGVP